MLTAFTSCCDKTPRFISGGKKSKSAADDVPVELIFPTISSFKVHHQNVNCLKLFSVSCQLEQSTGIVEVEQQGSSHTNHCEIEHKSENKIFLASCSESINLFDVTISGSASPITALLNGHEKDVKSLTVSEKDSLLFSVSRDCSLCYWDLKGADSSLKCRLANLHELIITCVDFNCCTNQLVTGSRDSCVKLLDVERQSCLASHKIPRNLVTCLCWLPGSFSEFVQTSEDKQVYLWDTRQMEPALIFPRKNWIQTSCDVSANGNLCVSTSNGFDSEGCEASTWDLRAAKLMFEYQSHAQTVHSCKFFPMSSSHFVTVSNDSTVNKWEVTSPMTPVDTKRPPTYSGLVSLDICKQDSSVYVGAVSGDVYVLKF